MPGTQFDDTIYYKKGVLTVSGPLEEEDDARQLVVFAFVTQPAENGEHIAVAGESRLFPTTKEGEWLLVRPKAEINPGPTTGPSKGLRYKYSLELSSKWRFKAQLGDLKKGPAFASAQLIVYKNDGTLESYWWSRGIQIDERP